MYPMYRAFFVVVILSLCWIPGNARADWTLLSGGSGNVVLSDVCSADGSEVVVAGILLNEDTGSWMPDVRTKVFFSSDGGYSFNDISGTLDDTNFGGAFAVGCFSSEHLLAAVNDSVFVTEDQGASWKEVVVGATVNAFHIFDAQHAVGVGAGGIIRTTNDGGATWQNATSPTSTDLWRVFFLANGKGWASGFDRNEYDDPFTGRPETVHENSVVIYTPDGGATWQQLAVGSALGLGDTTGFALGPLAFADDGQTGWLAAWEYYDEQNQWAYLLRTEDGGQTYVDVNLPQKVGVAQAMFALDLTTNQIITMHWSDADNGHLSGMAYVASRTDVATGEVVDIYQNVDYFTNDGGLSWQVTDLGTFDFTAGTAAPETRNDGRLTRGWMTGLYSGWMVGDRLSVWGYEKTCTTDNECGAGSVCGAGNICAPGSESAGDPNGDNNGMPNGGCGCSSDAGNAAWAWLGLFGLLGLGLRRRS